MAMRRRRRGVVLGAVVLSALMLARPAGAQVVTITLRSADALLVQFRTLAKLAGDETARPMLEALDTFDKGALKGVDRTRPLTVTGDFDVDTGVPSLNVFLPITSRDELLGTLKGFGFAVDDHPGVNGFSHKVSWPANGQMLFVLADPPAGYVVLTSAPDRLPALRAVKPAELKPDRPGSVLIGFRLDRIPELIKQAFVTQLKQRDEVQRQRREGESDDAYKGRMTGLTLAEDGFTSLVRDGRELSLDADVDTESGRMVLALGVDARPDTAMARTLAIFSHLKRGLGRVAGLPFSLQGVLPVPEAFRTMARARIAEARAQAEKDAPDDDSRMRSLLLDALEPSLTGETLECCVALDSPAPAKNPDQAAPPVVLFGFAVKNSKQVEAAVREAVAKSNPEQRKKVAFNHDRGAGGTPIHRLELNPAEVGRSVMYVALPEGAAFAAVGEDGLAVLKPVLTTLKAGGPAEGPQIEMDVALARLGRMNLGDKGNQEPNRQAAREVFQGNDSNRDHLRLVLNGTPSRLLLRLDADLPVLRFLSRAGALSAKAKNDQNH